MNIRRLSAKFCLVVPFALLAVPACIGAPGDAVDEPSSIERRQSAYISVPEVDEGNDGDHGVGGNTSGGSSSGPPALEVTFETCTNDTRRNEMRDALEDILDNWSAFEANLNARGLTTDHDCMYNRLTDNGNVHCEACDDPNLAGHSVLLGHTANVCRAWASGIEARYPNTPERRKICWASLLMHEFKHSCMTFEGGAEEADNAARETLNDVYGQSLDLDSECNQDM